VNKESGPFYQIRIGLGIAILLALTGCVGYVDGGYGGAVVVPGPDVYFYGGDYHGGGRDAHVDSHRGFVSRAAAHSGGGGRGIKR